MHTKTFGTYWTIATRNCPKFPPFHLQCPIRHHGHALVGHLKRLKQHAPPLVIIVVLVHGALGDLDGDEGGLLNPVGVLELEFGGGDYLRGGEMEGGIAGQVTEDPADAAEV